jgi:hypothetical protein
MSIPFLPSPSSVPNLAVPALLVTGLVLVATFVAARPSFLAGRLLGLGEVYRAAGRVVRRRRVERRTVRLLSAAGGCVGLSVGAGASLWIGAAGWLVGAGVVILGVLLPLRHFQRGWRRSLVREANEDCLALLQMVYVLSGVGNRPIDQAVRGFSQAWRDRSALARLLAECAPAESPVEFLAALDVPGQQIATAVLTLRQARRLAQGQRRWLLEQRLDSGITDMHHRLERLARQRASMAIVAGVLILLPTLMIAIMTPPILQAVQQVGGSGVTLP